MTETTQHPVDLALRTLTTSIDPSRTDFDYSRVRLMDAIASTTGPRTRTRTRLSWAVGLAVVALIAVLMVQSAFTSPAEALITDLARVVEARDPLVIPDGQFAYTQTRATKLSEVAAADLNGVQTPHASLVYRLSQESETWVGDQGTVRTARTNLQPQFFTAAEETAYYAASIDERDRLGEVQIDTQTDVNQILTERQWPTDPTKLEATMRSVAGDADQRVLEICLEMLRATLISPELRTGVLGVIAELDVELVDESPDRATFSASFEEPFPMQLTFTLDDLGNLRFEELVQTEGFPELGVPPGTIDYSATYGVPVLVDSLEQP